MRLRRPSTLAFLATCAMLVAIKQLFDFYPGDYPVRGQAAAFTWPLVGAVILIASLGLLADRALRFPEAFADLARERRGLLIATITGLAYGLLTIVMDMGDSAGGNPLVQFEWPHV